MSDWEDLEGLPISQCWISYLLFMLISHSQASLSANALRLSVTLPGIALVQIDFKANVLSWNERKELLWLINAGKLRTGCKDFREVSDSSSATTLSQLRLWLTQTKVSFVSWLSAASCFFHVPSNSDLQRSSAGALCPMFWGQKLIAIN